MAGGRVTARTPAGRAMGVAFILIGSAGFGSSAILIKLLLRSHPGVVTVLGVRYALAALVAAIAMRLTGRSFPDRRQALTWVSMGAFNILSAITFWTALTLGDVSHVAPIVYIFPAMVALGASTIFHERLTGSTWAAIWLGMAGAALVFQTEISHPKSTLAAGLALVSAVTAAIFYIVAGRVIGEDDWLPATATVFTSAALVYLPIVAVAGWQPPDDEGWGLVVVIAIAGSVAPFMLFFAGITRIGATHAAILSVAEPVITVSLALAVLGEHLSAVQAIGIVLVLVSFLAAGARRRENVEPT